MGDMMPGIKDVKDVEDFVRGATFLGTGGGGDPAKGIKFLKETFEKFGEIRWISPEEISDNSWVATPYYMGSIAPLTEEAKKKMKALGLTKKVIERVLPEAVKELQAYTQKKISGLVAVELGGLNTPGPIDAGMHLGIPILDGDYAGRAIPEICQTTPPMFGLNVTPIASVDEWGNKAIIKEAVNPEVAENIGKLISVAGFGLVGQAGYLMDGKTVKKVIIPGTLTKSLELGKAIREAREKGSNPVKAAVEYLEGWLLFKGVVTKKEWWDKEGYMWGITHIEGIDEFKGHKFKIWFKNENHVSWLDEEPYVTSPDIIEVVRLEDAEPITNTDLQENTKVAVVGAKCHPKLRTPEGLKVLAPPHFGFEDIEYKPIEKVV